MDAMRWTILGVGVLVLLAIYAFGRWRDRRRRHAEQKPAAAAAGSAQGRGGVAGAGEEGGGGDLRPGQSERPVIDDDELRGIDDLLAEREELAPEELDLGLDLGERPAASGATSQTGEQGDDRPWWQSAEAAAGEPDERTGTPHRSAAAEAERAGLAPAGEQPQAAAGEPVGAGADAAGSGSQPAGHADAEPVGASDAGSGAEKSEPSPAGRGGGTATAGVEEPAPLKLSPASQVEIAAYRSGDVEEAEKILVAFVAAPEGERFRGAAIERALRRVRMVPGEQRIWHRRGQSETGRVTLFSAASMVEPGYLDPEETLPGLETPGLVFFMQLPLPVDGEQVLDAMLATAYQVSVELGGELLDSTRSTMTQQIAEHMREQLREHRRRLHIAVHKRQ
ncbi:MULTISPECIES: cell division protein ZipA C-terminal FtsZ-binding domain-containing protein [Halorhodospira]|uniref:cell division protein ZipA C-terminal FtsZ-binding domain-containing protein n=1 Tax=Halorhodospira TaxID=85108 RepID=UPI001EE7DF55|nr:MULTISPECIES: cell division protein ZipA C-terminal FtsZ-binding domain-containing protein [Halorhodospira]MCG5527681.1 cell division protein ZipA C-terminal FtsZ-binding domain-containing protein [Halorhodospira halophila]MCG5542449.1 cell division protein ZipA C-terminal FtsZ-binding domain-containing protein [Halorhodospira sp. 9628]